MPLDPVDFQSRPWIRNSGWPISYQDVARYYPQATALCEAGEAQYDARYAVPGGMRPLLQGFAPRDFSTDGIERFSCPTDFGRRYRHRLERATSVRVLLHANCTRLAPSPDGARIGSADVRTLDGNRFTVTATQFVVATGALEVARLLLASNDIHVHGIGNSWGLVGRYYMCHIAGSVGTLRIDRPLNDVWHGYDRSDEGVYCRRRISLTEQAQRREHVGNTVFRLHHPRIPDPRHGTGALSAMFLAQRFVRHEYRKRLETDRPISLSVLARHTLNVGVDCVGTSRFLAHWVRDRVLAERKFPTVIIRPRRNIFSLDFNAEQEPNVDSHVRLGAQTDQLGMPRLHIDWRYTEGDVQTVATAFRLLQRDIGRSGVGELSLDPDEADFEAVIRRDGAYGGHHIGTARMASDPFHGVVDAHCRVFDINNLYVAGSAVFPTSGQANPTLTIVALSLRLAQHLLAERSRPARMLSQFAAPVPQAGHVAGNVLPIRQVETVNENAP